MNKISNAENEPVNHEIVEEVKTNMLPTGHLSRAVSFFKAIGDETRMKILYALSQYEMCVNDIAAVLDMSKSAVSHQLKLLKMEGQVKNRRDGKNIYYALDDQHVVHVLAETLEHVKHKMNDEQPDD